MNYATLLEQEPQCKISTVDIKCKPFIGFPITTQYDVERHSIPMQYKPVYVENNSGQLYYGVVGGFSLPGFQLYYDIIGIKQTEPSELIKVLDSWNINIRESYKYTTNKVISLDFDKNRNLLEKQYGNLDVLTYKNSKLPDYIKVAGMYIFIFIP